ncbi:ABC transporter substrate-binding protein [Xanthobacteraceae bacterium Astr-EGSB]|uniref:ABC transporter substrate-binding protein n=1 Tax=Astrobacterium formosum TaxID=3069710 RepID=UPI0027B51D8A|nr:ABC transporter substrate-binding protein [Xanthobacteraceae bacterium Astr-EGSB]
MTIAHSRVSRRRILAGGGAAAALLAAPKAVRAQAKALKIAVLLPRSGYLAAAGQSCHRGALIAPKVLADHGHRVELLNIDFESNVDIARTQTERAIGEGAQVIVGAFESGATLAIAQVCEQRQVPFVINIAAAPQITEQGYKYLVRNFQTGGQLLTNGLKSIKDLSAATKVDFKAAAFLHANDTFGTGQRQAMDKIFPTAGMPFKLLESIAYDPKAQDLTVEVTKIRALNPDLILLISRSADAIKLVRDMVRQRFEPKAIISPGSPGLYDEEFYQALGPLADFHIYNLPWTNPKASMTQALETAFKAAHPSNRFAVDAFNVGFTFEALLIAADGFKRAGTAAGPELMKAIRATNIADHVMIGAALAFDDKGQNNNIGTAIMQNRNRTPTVVLPAEAATMAPVLPMPGWQARA